MVLQRTGLLARIVIHLPVRPKQIEQRRARRTGALGLVLVALQPQEGAEMVAHAVLAEVRLQHVAVVVDAAAVARDEADTEKLIALEVDDADDLLVTLPIAACDVHVTIS